MAHSTNEKERVLSRQVAEEMYGSMQRLNGSRELKLGDQIVTDYFPDGLPKRLLNVREVEHYACSQRATHVNGRDCHSQYIPLHVIR